VTPPTRLSPLSLHDALPISGLTSAWNSAAASFYPSHSRSANENRRRGRTGFRRLFRPRHHVVDGRLDLGVAQAGVPAPGRHRSRGPLHAVEGAGVESVWALCNVLG